MPKILSIKSITTKAGDSKVLIQTADRDIWLSIKQYLSKGCSSVFDNYTGGNIETDFAQKGDKLFNGVVCTESDKILMDFTISANPAVLANSLAIEAKMKMDALVDSSSLFARNKATAKSAEPVKGEKQLAK